MFEKFLELENNQKGVNNLLTAILNNKNCSVFGMNFSQKSFVLEATNKPFVFVTESFDVASKMQKQMESMNKKSFVCYGGRLEISAESFVENELYTNIVSALSLLACNQIDCLIISPEILLQRLPDAKVFKKNLINFVKDKEYEFSNLPKMFTQMGYQRVDMVTTSGEFSIRGDIVDIFPINSVKPIRFNFFDNLLESIREFDIITYLTTNSLNEITICPKTLMFFEDCNIDEIVSNIREYENKDLKKLKPEEQANLKNICENLILKLENREFSNIGNFVIPFLNYNSNILSYLNNGIVVFDDVKQIYDKVSYELADFEQSFTILNGGGELLSVHKNYLLPITQAFESNQTKLSFQQITTSNRIFNPDEVFSFKNSNLTNYYGKYDLLDEELKYYLDYDYTVIIFARDQETTGFLSKYLSSHEVENKITNKNNVYLKKVNIISEYLQNGAVFVEDKIVIIGSNELLGKQEVNKLKVKNKKDVFSLPKENEYVVHDVYGIGLCKGVKRLKLGSYEKDYIVIEYDKGDILYLPTEQVDLISTYIASSNKQKLNKLGSQDFAKTKQKVKNSVKEMAFDLMRLYAERQHAKGFKFCDDDMLTKEFENSFPYEETEDQLQAIKDVKQDMESDKIMDRLICGDVGYGKTEVAIRAIFKAFQSGKQVAFLAPTTILSEQHYANCKARLSPFMCNVDVLNRFKTTKQQKEILKNLKEGKIDVICGTHRLLSKDVEFKDLGLLILDEEQRFGVQDKEKIKNLKNNIDVLTLSATPIPRTLHMSLSGIRDISLITTPPTGRMPIQSCVTEFSLNLIKEAVLREINRGGQVLIVYNKVEDIYSFAHKIKGLFDDDLQFGVAHGQMQEKELENEVLKLYNGTTKVLISTTLIENGIDLPNANTLIVVDADKLGLSQLYQLKGRVGRSKTLGYAYFLYDKNKILKEDAYKRLNAIMEFTELGSGFKIALKDLEIRGCGNIMGKEQHGHMQKVGYDMYCKLLNQAVMEIRGEKIKQSREVKIDVALNCYIPNEYILESDSRFRVYGNMITIKNEQERLAVLKEITDIYGSVPVEVDNLSKISLLRYLCQSLGIKRVVINQNTCKLEFYSSEECVDEKIEQALSMVRKQYSRNLKENFSITFVNNNDSVKEKLEFVINLLTNANNYKK